MRNINMNNLISSSIKAATMSFALSASSLLPTAVGAREIAFHTFASIDGGTIDTELWKQTYEKRFLSPQLLWVITRKQAAQNS